MTHSAFPPGRRPLWAGGRNLHSEIRDSAIRIPWPRPGNSRYDERRGGIQKQQKQEHDSQTMSRLPIPSWSRDGEGGPQSEIRNRNIPVIALPAYAMKGDREKMIEAGCNGYIEKPIDPKTIIAQIKQVIGEEP